MNALKLARLLRGLSQDALATDCKLSQARLSRIERRVRAAESDERVRLAQAVGRPIAEVFDDEGFPLVVGDVLGSTVRPVAPEPSPNGDASEARDRASVQAGAPGGASTPDLGLR